MRALPVGRNARAGVQRFFALTAYRLASALHLWHAGFLQHPHQTQRRNPGKSAQSRQSACATFMSSCRRAVVVFSMLRKGVASAGFAIRAKRIFLLVPVVANIAATPAPQALLQLADAVRNPQGSFSTDITLNEYRERRLVATSSLVVYSQPAENSGQYNNLIKFTRPVDDAGKLMLRNGIDLWLFDPVSSASIRISPQARLLGQASNGDVMSTVWAKDYAATLTGAATVADGDGAARRCSVLHLLATRPDVTYQAIDLWLDQDSHAPVRADYRTQEGRLLKTAYFRRFENILGVARPTETVIIDGLNPDWVTVMESAHITTRSMPATWFQRSYLGRFAGDAG